jgi:hypothetical protein
MVPSIQSNPKSWINSNQTERNFIDFHDFLLTLRMNSFDHPVLSLSSWLKPFQSFETVRNTNEWFQILLFSLWWLEPIQTFFYDLSMVFYLSSMQSSRLYWFLNLHLSSLAMVRTRSFHLNALFRTNPIFFTHSKLCSCFVSHCRIRSSSLAYPGTLLSWPYPFWFCFVGSALCSRLCGLIQLDSMLFFVFWSFVVL